jgi:AraC-like DNA-binding protein
MLADMHYREFAPGEDAGRFVDCFWVLEGATPGAVQRVVPDGRPELILNLGQPFESLQNGQWQAQPHCFLAGQLTGPLLLRAPDVTRILGVRFRPGGAAQLLGMPAQELTDRVVPAGDLGLKSLAELSTLRELEGALLGLERGSADPLVDEAARLLSRSPDVETAAASLGVSRRQLERRFKTRVGMQPKHFARIRRFQRVFHAMEGDSAGWVDAAADCGYYDQAHLIRDFRDFAGEPPSLLLAADDLARHFLSHFSKTHSSGRR